LDIAAKNQENDGYGSDMLTLEPQHGSVCISVKVDIQDLMCLLAKMPIDLSVHVGSLVTAHDDPFLSMHHLGHQSFPSVKYKQIQYEGITSSFGVSTNYDEHDPLAMKTKMGSAASRLMNATSSEELLPTSYSTTGVSVVGPTNISTSIATNAPVSIGDVGLTSADSTKNVNSPSPSFATGMDDAVKDTACPSSSNDLSLLAAQLDCCEEDGIADDDDILRLFPELVKFVLDLQSEFKDSIADVFANGDLVPSADIASDAPFGLIPSSDLKIPIRPGAEKLPMPKARIQSNCFPKTFDMDADCTIVPVPVKSSLINGFSCKCVANLRSLMGSDAIGEHLNSECLQFKAPSDSDAAVLPFNQGPIKLLTTSNGSLKSLPFNRGPGLSSAVLRTASRLLFQVLALCFFMHLESASYIAFPVLKVLLALVLQQVIGGLLIALTLCLCQRNKLKILEGDLRSFSTLFQGACFSLCDLTFSGKDFKLMGSIRNRTALCTCAFRLSVCPLYSLPVYSNKSTEMKDTPLFGWRSLLTVE